jgi:hypothetical protein
LVKALDRGVRAVAGVDKPPHLLCAKLEVISFADIVF